MPDLGAGRFQSVDTACPQVLAHAGKRLLAALRGAFFPGADAVQRTVSMFEDLTDHACGVRSGQVSSADQPLRCPLDVFVLDLGHVLVIGRGGLCWGSGCGFRPEECQDHRGI